MAALRAVIPNWGMKAPTFKNWESLSLAELELDEWSSAVTPEEVLFTTTQRRLLGLLFGQSDLEFHTSQLIEMTGSGAGATHRELCRLEHAGLLRSRREGNRKYYEANGKCSIYPELVAMVRNTFGLGDPLRAAFASIAREVEVAFAFDCFDQRFSKRPALELLIVSSSAHVPFEGIDSGIEFAQSRLRRGLRVLVVAPGELKHPRWYLERALAQPRTWVFGDERRLAAITSGP